MARIRVMIDLQREGETTIHRMGFGARLGGTLEELTGFLLSELKEHVVDLLSWMEGKPTRWDTPEDPGDIFVEMEEDDLWKKMFGDRGSSN